MFIVRFALTFLTILILSEVVLMSPMLPGQDEIATDAGVRMEQVDDIVHQDTGEEMKIVGNLD